MKLETRLLALLGSALVWACTPAREPSAPEPRVEPAAATGQLESAAPAQPGPAAEAPASAPAPARPMTPGPSSLGASEESRAKAPSDEEFRDLAAAERALEQARSELDQLALAGPAAQRGESAADARAEKKGEPKADRPRAAGGVPAKSQCEQTCRAWSSLSRAASAVCRLDGNSGAHCTRAKRVLLESEPRIARCSCPASGD